MKCFVSYTTIDKEVTADLLQLLAMELRKVSDVFIDMLDNNSLDKQGRVISELEGSDILILIETESIYKSEWVSMEIKRAKEKLIPIKIISLTELTTLIKGKKSTPIMEYIFNFQSL
jgi:hypothetical protein